MEHQRGARARHERRDARLQLGGEGDLRRLAQQLGHRGARDRRGRHLPVGRGVIVDDQMRTGDIDIFAVGECAEHRGVAYGLVAPIWDMCRTLAAAMTGDDSAAYEGSLLSTRLKVSGVDVFSAGKFSGVVTFPSFHTMMALIVGYAWRGFGLAARPADLVAKAGPIVAVALSTVLGTHGVRADPAGPWRTEALSLTMGMVRASWTISTTITTEVGVCTIS